MKRRSQSIYLQLLTDKHAPEHYRYSAHTWKQRVKSSCYCVFFRFITSVTCFLSQSDRQRVAVWRVRPCFPLSEGFSHEPGGQMLRVVTPLLAWSPPCWLILHTPHPWPTHTLYIIDVNSTTHSMVLLRTHCGETSEQLLLIRKLHHGTEAWHTSPLIMYIIYFSMFIYKSYNCIFLFSQILHRSCLLISLFLWH